ncbi:hypothetical protein M3J07_002870 [Ascochyta lentis]
MAPPPHRAFTFQPCCRRGSALLSTLTLASFGDRCRREWCRSARAITADREGSMFKNDLNSPEQLHNCPSQVHGSSHLQRLGILPVDPAVGCQINTG